MPPFFTPKKGGAQEKGPSLAGEAGSGAKDLRVVQNEEMPGPVKEPGSV